MSKSAQGLAFEMRVAEMFKGMGYSNVKLTPPTKDGGIDILMYKGMDRCGVECKDHRKPIGRPVIQRFHSALDTNGMRYGYVVISGKFSPDALKCANDINSKHTDLHIELINGKELERRERGIIEAKRRKKKAELKKNSELKKPKELKKNVELKPRKLKKPRAIKNISGIKRLSN